MSNKNSSDPYDLARFVAAQAGTYETALAELNRGQKQTHWMWFVFPQLRGLGRSPTSQFYGLTRIDEAVAYAQHEILGPRLHEVCRAILAHTGRTALEIFGRPDDQKLHSCVTLFTMAVPQDPLFRQVLDQFFGGRPDPHTVRLCKS